MSLAALFVVMAFLVMVSLIGNVSITVNQKIETQNAADAVAYSSAVEMGCCAGSFFVIRRFSVRARCFWNYKRKQVPQAERWPSE